MSSGLVPEPRFERMERETDPEAGAGDGPTGFEAYFLSPTLGICLEMDEPVRLSLQEH